MKPLLTALPLTPLAAPHGANRETIDRRLPGG